MGGMCGVVFADQKTTVDRNSLMQMARALAFSKGEEVRAHCSSPVGLSIALSCSASENIAETIVHGQPVGVAVFGVLYQVAGENHRGYGLDRMSACVLDGYVKNGLSIIRQLRGDFVLAIWDGREYFM